MTRRLHVLRGGMVTGRADLVSEPYTSISDL